MVGISTNIDPPLPPSYDEDLAEWLRDREHAQAERERVGDCAGNHDEPKIAASASTWRLGHDVPASERTGLWHVRLLIGCSMAIPAERLQFDSATEYRPAAPGTEEGDPYDESRYAAQAAPEKRHFMCIKKNKSGFFDVGQISESYSAPSPEYWLPCDKDGWIAHVPTPTSTCPVPNGVTGGEVRLRDGTVEPLHEATKECWQLGYEGHRHETYVDIVAWRPVRSDA
jgi:hypothetical protein